ncbi:MAG: superoxide dismutase [Methanospirillum sp.]|nr:superoxide dismutase [Methanospirillum sp.]
MEKTTSYSLPPLPYGYGDLAPSISEEQLRLHHDKHHNAYVVGANVILEKLDAARAGGTDLDLKATLKEFSFHVGGHTLHAIFWKNLAPAGRGGGGTPSGELGEAINAEFGSFERFKKEFSAAASSTEGSGWAALSLCRMTGRPIIMQIEKHNVNVYPACAILMVLDVWEHAYYLDYKNDRAKYVENFWQIVNWEAIAKRYEFARGT